MNRRRIRTGIIFLMVALLALVSLAGCAEEEEVEPGTTTIYLPLLIPLSGSAATGYAIIPAMGEALINYIEDNDPIPGVKLELLPYDTKLDTSEAIPGYEYLVSQGALFVANTDSETANTLKSRVDEDKFPIFMTAGSTEATSNPGYVFCIPMDYYDQIQPIMEWIMDNWDYETMERKPKVGLFGWNMGYGIDRKNSMEDYTAAYPDKFDYVGAQMAPYGTTSWTTEVEALKDCDYIIHGAFASGAAAFMATMRANGYTTPKFCMIGPDTGFMSIYLDTPGKEALDGSLWAADAGYWKSDISEIADITRDLLDDYFTGDLASQKAWIEGGGMPSLPTVTIGWLVVIETIREAVSQVDDPADITGELIHDVAETMMFSYDGWPTLNYSETLRALLIYEKVYEYSATADDWHPAGDWIKAPSYE